MSDIEARRNEVLTHVKAFILENGLGAASLRPLAKAAGTSDRMLLYYFEDKSDLLTQALQDIALDLTAALEAAAPPAPVPADTLFQQLRQMPYEDDLWSYMRLWLEMASLASRGDALCQTVGASLGRGFLDWIVTHIESGSSAERDAEAARLFCTFEGMVLLKGLGLGDIGQAF